MNIFGLNTQELIIVKVQKSPVLYSTDMYSFT